jgi:enolase
MVSLLLQAVQLAKSAGWGVLTSHRSGETGDDFIADLSVGLSTGHIKSGAPARCVCVCVCVCVLAAVGWGGGE